MKGVDDRGLWRRKGTSDGRQRQDHILLGSFKGDS